MLLLVFVVARRWLFEFGRNLPKSKDNLNQLSTDFHETSGHPITRFALL